MESQDCGQNPRLFIAKLDTLLTMPPFGDKQARPFGAETCIESDGLESPKADSDHFFMNLRG